MLQPKPHIEKLVSGTHGGIDYGELAGLGISPDSVLDFSVSTNPFGPPPSVAEALSNASIEHYPDSESTLLRRALARRLDISMDSLIIGSGSTELIRLIALAYFGTGDSVIVPQPTYGEYEVASRLVGAQVVHQLMPEETSFRLDIAQTVYLMRKHHPKGIFLCNPNNPTGQYLSKEEAGEVLDSATDSLVILDEAYIAFTENAWSSLDLIERSNVVLVRSMTKDYALAGLRLGYAVSSEPIISVLKRVKPPWNVSAIAQQAGIAALEADGYLEECGIKLREAKEFLMSGLKDMGLSPLPSQTNFFLVRVGDAAAFKKALLKEGILVRDCTSFGLADYIRLAPRPIPECRRLLAAIEVAGVCRDAR